MSVIFVVGRRGGWVLLQELRLREKISSGYKMVIYFITVVVKKMLKKSIPIRTSLRWVSRIVSTSDNRPNKVKCLRF